MATEEATFQGKGKWIRLFSDDGYGNYSLNLYPNPASLDSFRALNVATHLQKDDDGYYFKCKCQIAPKMIKGKMVPFLITVVDKNGIAFNREIPIGNFSDLTVKVDVYGYTVPGTGSKKKAMRLKAVRVDNLVEFNPNADLTPDEAKNVIETPPAKDLF